MSAPAAPLQCIHANGLALTCAYAGRPWEGGSIEGGGGWRRSGCYIAVPLGALQWLAHGGDTSRLALIPPLYARRRQTST